MAALLVAGKLRQEGKSRPYDVGRGGGRAEDRAKLAGGEGAEERFEFARGQTAQATEAAKIVFGGGLSLLLIAFGAARNEVAVGVAPAACLGRCRVKLRNMEVTLNIPDHIAKKLAAAGGDVSRRALEAIALEGYREQTLTLFQVSEMLGLTRVETEDFLGQHHVPLATISEGDLDREAGLFKAASLRNPL